MTSDPAWVNTTHDWATAVDLAHLDVIRSSPQTYAPDGALHLVLEVMAYADEEAGALRRPGACTVTVHTDGSVSVADDGRGTDTRRTADGEVVRKPVMATSDLRFFDRPHAAVLPDGRPRRGISVVAALSSWLTHTNRRTDGAWTQRYERGVPTTDLMPLPPASTTGTTVRFLVDTALVPGAVTADQVREVAAFDWLTTTVQSR